MNSKKAERLRNELNIFERLKRFLGLKFYNFKVALRQKFIGNKNPLYKKRTIRAKRRNDLIFYCVMLILPVTQFLLMWVGVNANSIFLAFKDYDVITGDFTFNFYSNFAKVFSDFKNNTFVLYSLKNSIIVYLVGNGLTIPISLFFSFYIYKKYTGSGFFKVILFLPSIISGVVTSITITYLAERAYPELVRILFNKEVPGLIANVDTTFATLLFTMMFFGFGGGILIYSGAMGNIPDSVIEAAHLDGAGTLHEFWHITLPYIFPTLSVFLTLGVAGILTADVGLFTYFGINADPSLYTFGYYMFKGIKTATIVDYPYYAAFGLVLTMVALPATLIVRKLLSKFGPSVV